MQAVEITHYKGPNISKANQADIAIHTAYIFIYPIARILDQIYIYYFTKHLTTSITVMRLLPVFVVLLSFLSTFLGFGPNTCRHSNRRSLYKRLFHPNWQALDSIIAMSSNSQTYAEKAGVQLSSSVMDTNVKAVSYESPNVKLYITANSPIPRSYMPALLVYNSKDNSGSDLTDDAFYATLESSLQWYLDNGGRISRLEFAGPPSMKQQISSFGFVPADILVDSASSASRLRESIKASTGYETYWMANPKLVIEHCKKRISFGEGDAHVLNDIIGRLYHDIGEPSESIDYYTKGLQIKPSSGSCFRNLGSAYHAIGNMQLAYASYQQSLQLDPKGIIVSRNNK